VTTLQIDGDTLQIDRVTLGIGFVEREIKVLQPRGKTCRNGGWIVTAFWINCALVQMCRVQPIVG
jgi:hypothetical protein